MFMLSLKIYLRISLVFSSIPLFGLMHICFDGCNEGCEASRIENGNCASFCRYENSVKKEWQ